MSEDLISRQAAIDAITKYCMQYDLRELLADIDAMPSAQPEQQCEQNDKQRSD